MPPTIDNKRIKFVFAQRAGCETRPFSLFTFQFSSLQIQKVFSLYHHKTPCIRVNLDSRIRHNAPKLTYLKPNPT